MNRPTMESDMAVYGIAISWLTIVAAKGLQHNK